MRHSSIVYCVWGRGGWIGGTPGKRARGRGCLALSGRRKRARRPQATHAAPPGCTRPPHVFVVLQGDHRHKDGHRGGRGLGAVAAVAQADGVAQRHRAGLRHLRQLPI